MYKALLIAGLFVGTVTPLTLQQHLLTMYTHDAPEPLIDTAPQDMVTGGWRNVAVESANKEIDAYIRAQIPSLATAKLTSASEQVVAGMNYKNVYEVNGTKEEITVWDQPWTTFRQITGIKTSEVVQRPNGEKVQRTTTTWVESEPLKEAAGSLFP